MREMERSLVDRLKVPLLTGPDSGLADLILQIAPQVRAAAHWDWVVERYLAPPLQRWIEDCGRNYRGHEFWEEWQERFFGEIRIVLENLERYSLSQQQEVSNRVRCLLEECGYPSSQASLSQVAMNILLNLGGVSCVLNGMRRTGYVRDAMGAVSLPRVDALSILREFSRKC